MGFCLPLSVLAAVALGRASRAPKTPLIRPKRAPKTPLIRPLWGPFKYKLRTCRASRDQTDSRNVIYDAVNEGVSVAIAT